VANKGDKSMQRTGMLVRPESWNIEEEGRREKKKTEITDSVGLTRLVEMEFPTHTGL
jgi:hypothetical protein